MAQVLQTNPQAMDEVEARERLRKQQGPPARGAARTEAAGQQFLQTIVVAIGCGCRAAARAAGEDGRGAQGRCC